MGEVLELAERAWSGALDGTAVQTISGSHDWQRVTFSVPATGAGGPDRVLRWEYVRSSYVNQERPPWNTVWIDDIDLPEWNTQPTVVLRQLVRSKSDIVEISRPSIDTVPALGGASPPRIWNNVDLPDPLGPTMATNSPRSTRRSTPRSACTSTSPTR